eukprot:6430686-Alexandrium_andersonii.AAC.1
MGSLCVGRNREARLKQLWVMMKQHYKEARTPRQLQGLTVEMVKRDTKSPKLRAKGGETRHLAPFGLEVATKLHE